MKKGQIALGLFCVLLLGSGAFYGQKLLEPSKDCLHLSVGAVLTQEELERFSQSWKDYQGQDFALESISLKTADNVRFPLKLRYFLAKHCFTPERFFEVEDRIRSAIHALYLRRHAAAVIDILNAELRVEKDEQRRATFEEMIVAQNKIAHAILVSDNDLTIIKQKMPEIEDLLEERKLNELR